MRGAKIYDHIKNITQVLIIVGAVALILDASQNFVRECVLENFTKFTPLQNDTLDSDVNPHWQQTCGSPRHSCYTRGDLNANGGSSYGPGTRFTPRYTIYT
jgi:hypothetical protein